MYGQTEAILKDWQWRQVRKLVTPQGDAEN